jgi:8-oxo-dGTP pyrophosphatase MutT (NUDIX family)
MNTLSDKEQFRESVQQTCDRYLTRFPDEEERLKTLLRHLGNRSLDLRLRSTIPEGHLCASGILLLPDSKVLMLEHKSLGIWVVPGGHYDIEDGELTATAIRETEEETGLTGVRLHPWHLENGIPLDIDTHPIPSNDRKNEGAHQHFDFRYVLEMDNPEETINRLKIDTNEVLDFEAIPISDVDPASSIAPALRKIDLLNQ